METRKEPRIKARIITDKKRFRIVFHPPKDARALPHFHPRPIRVSSTTQRLGWSQIYRFVARPCNLGERRRFIQIKTIWMDFVTDQEGERFPERSVAELREHPGFFDDAEMARKAPNHSLKKRFGWISFTSKAEKVLQAQRTLGYVSIGGSLTTPLEEERRQITPMDPF